MTVAVWRWGIVHLGLQGLAPQVPTVRPGVWEMTSTRDSGDGTAWHPGKSAVCFDKRSAETMLHPSEPAMPGCTVQSSSERGVYTFDWNCTEKVHGHGTTTIADAEHVEQVFELDLKSNGGADHRSVTRLSYRFLHADCGTVKPDGSPVVE